MSLLKNWNLLRTFFSFFWTNIYLTVHEQLWLYLFNVFFSKATQCMKYPDDQYVYHILIRIDILLVMIIRRLSENDWSTLLFIYIVHKIVSQCSLFLILKFIILFYSNTPKDCFYYFNFNAAILVKFLIIIACTLTTIHIISTIVLLLSKIWRLI